MTYVETLIAEYERRSGAPITPAQLRMVREFYAAAAADLEAAAKKMERPALRLLKS